MQKVQKTTFLNLYITFYLIFNTLYFPISLVSLIISIIRETPQININPNLPRSTQIFIPPRMWALIWLIFSAVQIYVSMASPIAVSSRDALTPYQQLVEGQTLVSPNQRFEMGFFCSRKPCKNSKFLGIWYKDLPQPENVVWVANRNQPIRRHLGGILFFDINGALVIKDSSSRVVWNNGELMKKPHTSLKQPVLQLLDSGNLVVRDGIGKNSSGGDEEFFWESFKFPTDTLLPGMKIGWDLKSGMNFMITSWKSTSSPSNGHYSFGLDNSQLPQLVQYKDNVRLLRWGPWDGNRFSGTNTFKENQVFRPVLAFDENEVSLTIQVVNESTLVRFVVTPLGELHFLKWKNSSKQWLKVIAFSKDGCDQVGSCGPYGMCTDPSCICLDGFVANSPGDWKVLDCSSGCGREYKLNCSDGDGFLKFEGYKLPDNSTVWSGLRPDQCGKECLKQCKCMAYTNLNMYGNGTMCVVWLTDLMDMQKSPEAGNEIYVRMARHQLESMFSSKTRKKVEVIIVVLFSAFSFTLLSGLLIRFLCQIRKAKCQENHGNSRSRESRISREVDEPHITAFDLDKIAAATNNFSRYNKIGHGGFGTVYKGELVGGVEIAVKRLCESSWQGLREFRNEVSLIAKLQHRNLVRLLGYCLQGSERILVYEFMPNRSLDQFLFDQAKRRLLPWATRFKIILGVAKGLVYLHDDSRLRVIHRDLKASNVLLDGEMNPKISDFGLARIFAGETQETTRRVIGTHGYMSPEYMMNGHFSTKSDVYSFGVLLMEIISGMKNWGFHHPDHELNLLGHAWKMWNEERPLDAMDPVMEESDQVDEVIRCIHVGLLCVQHQPEERPTMSQVLSMLRGDSASLPQPHEPGFFTGRSIMGLGITTIAHHLDSVNGLTITTLTGR